MKNNKFILIFMMIMIAAFIFNGCKWTNNIIDDWWVGTPERTADPVIPITVYTVKFDMNGGTYVDLRDPVQIPPAGPIPDQLVQAGFEASEPGMVEYKDPSRKYFAGWWNTETNIRWTFTTKVNADADPNGDGIINLQARWNDTGIIVTFDPNLPVVDPPFTNDVLTYGGPPLPEYVVQGIEISEPKDFGFKDNSYIFLGWLRDKDDANSKWDFYTDKAGNSNFTLYARWAKVEITDSGKVTPPGGDTPKQVYAIDFEDNVPGSPPIPTQYKLEDDPITKPNAIDYPGYVFEGWYPNPSFTGNPWDFANQKVSEITSNDFDEFGRKKVKLYAKWTPIVRDFYTIKFDMNGGSYVDSLGSQTEIPNQFVQTGDFAHEPGLVEHASPDRYFGGWWNIETGNRWKFDTNKAEAAEDADSDGVIILQAKWGSTGYTVSFDPNPPGTNTTADLTYIPEPEYVADGVEVSEPKGFGLKNTDYYFIGWYRGPGRTNKWDFNDPVTGDLNLHAEWEADPSIIYKIIFEADTNECDVPVQYKLVDDTVTRPDAITKKDHFFGGWFTEPAFSNSWDFGTALTLATVPVTDASGMHILTLYAKWIRKTDVIYTVKFDMNGGTYVDLRDPPIILPAGPIPDQYVRYNNEAAEPGLVVNAIFPYFAGWFNIETDARFTFTTPITEAVDTNGDYVVDLQARWSSTGITVTYNTNLPWGYTDEDTTYGRPPLPERVVPGIELQEPKDFGLKNSPYLFLGWYIDDNGDGFLDSDEITKWNFATDKAGNTDFTLYARWELMGEAAVDGKQIYAVNFTHNVPAAVYFPNQPIPTQYKLEGDKVSKPSAIDYPGYVFAGWYTNRNLTGAAWDFANNTLSSSTPSTGTDSAGRRVVTLYAKWEPIPYTEPWYKKYFAQVDPSGMQFFPFQCNTGDSDYMKVTGAELEDNLYFEEDIIDLLSSRPDLVVRIIGYKDTANDPERLVTDREEKTWENLYANGANGIKPEQLIRNTKLPSGVTASNNAMIIGPNEEYDVKESAPNDDEVRIIMYIPIR